MGSFRGKKKVKDELVKLNYEENEYHRAGEGFLLKEIVKLRDYYMEFSGDKTRSPTMRLLASEFSVKLTELIRRT